MKKHTRPGAGLNTPVLTAPKQIQVKQTIVKPCGNQSSPSAMPLGVAEPAHIAGVSLRPKQAATFLGISIATYWRWCKERHDFPKPLRLSSRCSAVPADALIKWRDAQASNGGGQS